MVLWVDHISGRGAQAWGSSGGTVWRRCIGQYGNPLGRTRTRLVIAGIRGSRRGRLALGLRRQGLQKMGHLETTAGPTGGSGKESAGRILLQTGRRSHGHDGRQLILALAPTSGRRATVGILHGAQAGIRKGTACGNEKAAKRTKRRKQKTGSGPLPEPRREEA